MVDHIAILTLDTDSEISRAVLAYESAVSAPGEGQTKGPGSPKQAGPLSS